MDKNTIKLSYSRMNNVHKKTALNHEKREADKNKIVPGLKKKTSCPLQAKTS